MENSKSNYVRILTEICAEENIKLSSYSSDWAFQLKKGEKNAFILGYQFGLNSSSVQLVCTDKNIASEVLKEAGIPSVYHKCYMSPRLQQYIGVCGNWASLLKDLEREKTIVCKDCCGTGGNEVYLVRNAAELEAASAAIFNVSESMAVCRYEHILEEYRLVLLDGSIRLAFTKIRPSLTGDGHSTIGELFGAYTASGAGSGLSVPSPETLKQVPAEGESFLLNWKHNLGQGASAKELSVETLPAEVTDLAARTYRALGIRFASVDVIRCEDGWKVLEINSGVMMEHFAGQSAAYYRKAKEIYRDAVLKMFL